MLSANNAVAEYGHVVSVDSATLVTNWTSFISATMGVTGLLLLLKSIQKSTHLRQFAGQTLGVDAYGWLHRGAVPCAADIVLGKGSTKYVDFAMHRVRMLVHFGVIPYLVFDGDRLPSKAGTEDEREERRKHYKNVGLELLRAGKPAQAHQEFQKAVDITPEMAGLLIEELKRNNIQYVVAPYEADAQMAYLEQKGIIDGIISEDSDLLVFGAKTLITKLDQYGECIAIRQADFTACREVSLTGWTMEEFRRMAILSGCDYLEGIHKMGLKTAYRLVRKCKTIQRTIQVAQLEGKFRIPTDYLDRFIQAETTFLYQWVYCPTEEKLVNLNPPLSDSHLDGITYIGAYVEPSIAQGVANGQLNPMTKLPIRVTWPRDYKPSPRIPARTEKENNVQSSNKKIDSFFTPSNKRQPLAELDPNSFRPTKSQQRLLDENNSRSWAPVPASRGSTSSIGHASTSISQAVLDPQSRKRQRLCTEGKNMSADALFNAHEERSKFFTGTKPKTPSIVAKKSRLPDVNIWSDDSIDDDAMAALTVPAPSASKPIAGVVTQTKRRRFEVFKDNGNSEFHDKTNPLEMGVLLENAESPDETPFTSGLLAQTRALRERDSSRINSRHDTVRKKTKPLESETKHDRPAEPVTPPSCLLDRQNHDSKTEDPAGESLATVEETPLVQKTKEIVDSHDDHNNKSKLKSNHTPTPASSLLEPKKDSNDEEVLLHALPKQPKGTEDLFIVPDSDGESGTSEYGDAIPSSPTRHLSEKHQVEPGEEEEQDENDEDNVKPRPASRFDLSRFAFGAAPTYVT